LRRDRHHRQTNAAVAAHKSLLISRNFSSSLSSSYAPLVRKAEVSALLHTAEDLAHRIKTLEKELQIVMERKEREFRYVWNKGKAIFEEEVVSTHKKLKTGLASYVLHSRIFVVLTAPIIYAGIIPFALLDLFLAIYQGVCFRAYGVPKVRRGDYVIFDRGHLNYLNFVEKLNCVYCSYANGLCAYATEVVARTEQHWCPIKHALRLRSPHSRYTHFFDYGDAEKYRSGIESVRCDFADLNSESADGSGPSLNPPDNK
jgi:hypothetical protein